MPLKAQVFHFAWVGFVLSAAFASAATIEISPPIPQLENQTLHWRLVLRVHGETNRANAIPQVTATGAKVVSLTPHANDEPGPALYFLHVTSDSAEAAPGLRVKTGTAEKIFPLPLALNLTDLAWETWWQGEQGRDRIDSLPPTSTRWQPARLPKDWNELGITWVRTRFVVPQTWQTRPLALRITAVDDRDVTFFNGRRIGQTDGWDRPRVYPVPADVVRWGETNELAIAVDNGFAGGGIYRGSIVLSSGNENLHHLEPKPVELQEEIARAQPGKIGSRLPLRPLHVSHGVLRYPDGQEAALWGVNYYPQSWTQYENLKKFGIDHRRSIDEDFVDFVALGLDVIRIHVFDCEITDGSGNLVRNEHLNLLDYVVDRCNAHGLYLMLTPIAWWGSPNARPESFSRNLPKQALSMWPASWPIQTNYLQQFLRHTNHFTGRRLVDEPCLALLEIINEPEYWTFGQVAAGGAIQGEVDPAKARRALEGVRDAFHKIAPSPEWETSEVFASFRGETLRRYINTMVDAMREIGAYQPIAYSFWNWSWQSTGISDLVEAIADSRCDAITLGSYPGGLPQDPRNDRQNHLSATANAKLDARLSKKARLVYEFDAAGTLHQVSLYPAMARQWRNLGVQVACQFQYDPRSLAHLNCDWPQHYLNLWHAPSKALSFIIGGEAFHRIPRGTVFPTPEDDQVFAPGAVSFQRNAALLCAADCYIQARPTDWQPLVLPKSPRRILSVGSCPFFAYQGSGVVMLQVEGSEASLSIYPDVDRLREDLLGSREQPLTRLVEREYTFRLLLPGWSNARVQRRDGSQWLDVTGSAAEFRTRPGEYRLRRL